MKHLLIMLTTTLLLQQAIAQTDTSVAVNKVIVSVAKSVNKIDVYKKSFDSVPAYQINSKDLVLPLQVSRQDEDFLLITLGKHEVWIDGAQVVMRDAETVACKKSSKAPTAVAAVSGAASACK